MRSTMVIWLVFCGAAVAEEADSTRTVLFYGDSLTAGYGIDREQAFPALIQARRGGCAASTGF